MNERLTINLSCGELAGYKSGRLVHFDSVPYAEPPVGDLRFKPPVAKLPWNGVYDTSSTPMVAPQTKSRLVGVMGDFDRLQSEDCLTLSIKTPACDNNKRPVVVWLHGGGFSSGSGALDWYRGDKLAEQGDVVFIGVNYRLGALGFLCLDGVSSGNLGLFDQALALRFIKAHIHKFGGDPNNIILMGQSAGGNSIVALYLHGLVPDGVRKVIMQSPAFGMAPQTIEEAHKNGELFLKELSTISGFPVNQNNICKVSTADILKGQLEVAKKNSVFGDTAPPFQLVAHNYSNPSVFHLDAIRLMQGVDVIVGVTSDEAQSFFALDSRTTNLSLGDAKKSIANVYGNQALARFEVWLEKDHDMSVARLFSKLVSYEVFEGPVLEFAKKFTQPSGNLFSYVFDWSPKGSIFSSCHCLELPFVFGNYDDWLNTPMLGDIGKDEFTKVADMVGLAWLNFIKNDNGSEAIVEDWPRFTADGQETAFLGNKTAVKRFSEVLL